MDYKNNAQINYPCEWCYKVIGEDREKMLIAVDTIIKSDSMIVHQSNTSKNGKYISLEIKVRVNNELERDNYFKLLAKHSEIRMVL